MVTMVNSASGKVFCPWSVVCVKLNQRTAKHLRQKSCMSFTFFSNIKSLVKTINPHVLQNKTKNDFSVKLVWVSYEHIF